jgi:hypothetical protein
MRRLREANGPAWRNRMNLWAYADLRREETHVRVGDMKAALPAVVTAGRAPDETRNVLDSVTMHDAQGWDDIGVLDVWTDRGGWSAGFRHPLFLLQAEAMEAAEEGGLGWEARLALQLPMGPFVDLAERLTLEACASDVGLQRIFGASDAGPTVPLGVAMDEVNVGKPQGVAWSGAAWKCVRGLKGIDAVVVPHAASPASSPASPRMHLGMLQFKLMCVESKDDTFPPRDVDEAWRLFEAKWGEAGAALVRKVREEGTLEGDDVVFALVTTRRVTDATRARAAAKEIAATHECPRVRMVVLDRSDTHDLWSDPIRSTAEKHRWTPYLP